MLLTRALGLHWAASTACGTASGFGRFVTTAATPPKVSSAEIPASARGHRKLPPATEAMNDSTRSAWVRRLKAGVDPCGVRTLPKGSCLASGPQARQLQPVRRTVTGTGAGDDRRLGGGGLWQPAGVAQRPVGADCCDRRHPHQSKPRPCVGRRPAAGTTHCSRPEPDRGRARDARCSPERRPLGGAGANTFFPAGAAFRSRQGAWPLLSLHLFSAAVQLRMTVSAGRVG